MSDKCLQIEKEIEIKFKDISLLRQALTHSSFSSDKNNERLEFLGDSVLNLVSAQYLFETFTQKEEGGLSKLKSFLVSRHTLLRWAVQLKLDKYLYLGKAEGTLPQTRSSSILVDAFESLIGAIYLDQGLGPVRNFILHYLKKEDKKTIVDFKSSLQEIFQKEHQKPPVYQLLKESGPDHDKTFEIGVFFNQKMLARGKGKNKKEAEQSAAQRAFKRIERLSRHQREPAKAGKD